MNILFRASEGRGRKKGEERQKEREEETMIHSNQTIISPAFCQSKGREEESSEEVRTRQF